MIKKTTNKSFKTKLTILYKLQLIDSYIDNLQIIQNNIRSDIKYLEKEIDKNNIIIIELKNSILEKEDIIKSNQQLIQNINKDIKEYLNKNLNIKDEFNNTETVDKNLEYKELEILLTNKKILEQKRIIIEKKNKLIFIKKTYLNQKRDLIKKKKELRLTINNNKKTTKKLIMISNSLKKEIDSNLLNMYLKIRQGVKNGLAIVPVNKGVSIGSYLFIPPQVHAELLQRKRMIIDEHSGRILIDYDLATDIKKEMQLNYNI